MNLNIHNTFSKELPADSTIENKRRQVFNACFSYVNPTKTSHPELIHVSEEMLKSLGLNQNDVHSETFLTVFTGNTVLKGTHPYAMCYGGHQFGHWAGQLGDGRAINLFEVNHDNKQWAFQLKGAGETPYSRTADGFAVLRSSIREHLCSEAMFHLGVPTTRSLSLSLTGDQVRRDMMYDGNPAYEKGAIVCRLAPSFIRFGNFEILASRNDHNTLKTLTDYTISHFYSDITTKGPQKYLDFLVKVRDNTIDMIVHWQRVGFVHGVMNTDNMSILGLTIDYGPYGWVEGYDHHFTPNTTDNQHKRYRFGNQAYIGMWNLYKLANALYGLIDDVKPIQQILEAYEALYTNKYEEMMLEKLGLSNSKDSLQLIEDLEKTLHLTETDSTIFFRTLSHVSKDFTPRETLSKIKTAFYSYPLKSSIENQWETWCHNYLNLLKFEQQSDHERTMSMNTVNPKYILRNYMAQLAINAADKGDYSLIHELYTLLKTPYSEQPNNEKWFAKRPEWARDKIGCSRLSCSS